MLLPKLIIDLDDLKQGYLNGTISEADFYRLMNARKKKFEEDERIAFEGQTKDVQEFFRNCRATGKVRAGR